MIAGLNSRTSGLSSSVKLPYQTDLAGGTILKEMQILYQLGRITVDIYIFSDMGYQSVQLI